MGLDVSAEDFRRGLHRMRDLATSHRQLFIGTSRRSDGRYLLGELDDQRQLVGFDKSKEAVFGQLPIKGVSPFVKLWSKRTSAADLF